MFKQLRNKFLFMNLGTILFVLFVSFASIFVITYKDVESDVKAQLNQVITQTFQNNNGKQALPPKEQNNNLELEALPPTISFWVEIDADRTIQAMHNPHFSSITNEMYTRLIADANLSKEYGFFSFDSGYWAYHVIETSNGYKIAFSDITNNVSTLTSMLFAFLIVSIISTILIACFSKFFADRAIHPIKSSFQKQKQFVSDASHELKTPLTIINTNIDLVLANKEDSVKSQEQWLQNIKEEASRMSKLTNNLLYLAKLDDGNVETIHSPCNLSDITKASTLAMEGIAFEKGLRIEDFIDPAIMVQGNPEQLRQVLIILLDNAIKYSIGKDPIQVHLHKQNNQAILTVQNHGETIQPDQQQKLFNRFYRIDNSRNSQTGGHGLGLAIAHDFVMRHNGKIAIDSQDDTTTLCVTLPIKN